MHYATLTTEANSSPHTSFFSRLSPISLSLRLCHCLSPHCFVAFCHTVIKYFRRFHAAATFCSCLNLTVWLSVCSELYDHNKSTFTNLSSTQRKDGKKNNNNTNVCIPFYIFGSVCRTLLYKCAEIKREKKYKIKRKKTTGREKKDS